jgi:RHH-type transcriptional regulator, rel operon repressor / antitoxin RelB
MSTTMKVRVEDEIKDRFDRIAESTRRSKSSLTAEAIRQYVGNHEWQIAGIHASLAEANAGDFARDADIAAVAKRWKADGR